MWRTLSVPKSELNLEVTLKCGQSFRWQQISGEWKSVLNGKLWILKQTDTQLLYRVLSHSKSKGVHEEMNKKDNEQTLRRYFQLETSLSDLYRQWSESDAHFKKISTLFPGVRVLRQDPVENVFSFICSSNNNISRITSMVEKLCTEYGDLLLEDDGIKWFSFPEVSSLAQDGVQERLRELGFGYRAKYIQGAAKYIADRGSSWLYKLRGLGYENAKTHLLELPGVGPKVADCVLLMSLDQPGSVPVDTHVFQIAARDYMPKLRSAKSVTSTIYNEIGDHFRELWGDHAGWAHSILFSADLSSFQHMKASVHDGNDQKGKRSGSGDHVNNVNRKKRKTK